MNKLCKIVAANMIAGVSLLAEANPPGAPDVYNLGPFSPRVATVSLSPQERQAFALLEGIMQSVEANIHVTGCAPVVLPLEVYSDAFIFPVTGDATLGNSLSPDKLVLNSMAVPEAGAEFRGEVVYVDQAKGAGYINGTLTTGYRGTMVFNSANNMMVGEMKNVSVMSINWEQNKYKGSVIKDFYMGQDEEGDPNATPDPILPDTHIVYDWGLQSLSKLGYPVEKYWQRSKVRRSDGGQGATVFVKDRLVGVTKCRITIALQGFNIPDLFWQSGTLTVSQAAPGDAVPEFAAIPNI